MDPFVALMRRYVVDYTNSHDLAVCDEIMEPDYVLRMGPHVVAGRDEAYKPATRKQLEQFPGLGLTVHEVVSNGERLALRFSEHGASVRHGGAVAVWGGIGLYAWNGRRLTANRVEQDYLARRRQLADGVPDTVPPPAPAPWDTAAREPDAGTERAARAWAEQGMPTLGDVVVDDGSHPATLVEPDAVVVDDLFSAGDRAAVHVTISGRSAGPRRGRRAHRRAARRCTPRRWSPSPTDGSSPVTSSATASGSCAPSRPRGPRGDPRRALPRPAHPAGCDGSRRLPPHARPRRRRRAPRARGRVGHRAPRVRRRLPPRAADRRRRDRRAHAHPADRHRGRDRADAPRRDPRRAGGRGRPRLRWAARARRRGGLAGRGVRAGAAPTTAPATRRSRTTCAACPGCGPTAP